MARPRYRLVRSRPGDGEAPALDEAQRAAVEHRGGPLLVLAGPGTGKTTTLVESVVDRVHRDGLEPEQVLVLTFSRRAAAELRDRITARLGRTIREPVARTFHSYAFGLLRQDAVLHAAPPPRLLSGPEQDLVIRDLLRGDVEEFEARGWPSRLRPALLTRGFAQELRDLLLRAGERGVDPTSLARLGRERGRDDWVAAARFARQYAAVTALRQDSPAYDPAELVRAACDLLRADGELLERERGRRVAVLVDEYQDSDPAQEDLLRLLAGGGRELVVVGDPDQSIYAFRGAEVEGIRRFPERFRAADGSEARTIPLTISRRAGPGLLAASRRVGARLGGPRAHRELRVGAGAGAAPDAGAGGDAAGGGRPGSADGAVEVHVLRSAQQEATYVAQRLREAHLVEGIPWARMAVLVRSAGPIATLRRALAAGGVPVAVRREEVPLVSQPAVRPLLAVLELATGRRELDPDLAFELVTSVLGGADPLALRRLRRELRRSELAAGGGRSSGALLVEALESRVEMVALDPVDVAPAARVADLLERARVVAAEQGATAEAVLWAVWSASGLAERWSRQAISGGPGAAAADRDLDAVTSLFDAAARFTDRMPAAGPAVFADHVLGQEIPADSLAARAPEGDAVAVLTAHAAKGLEWDVVAVAGVQEGIWPDLRIRGTLLGSESLVDAVAGREGTPAMVLSRLLAEERRLFYVSVTRARRRLLVTAESSEDAHPSRFLDELEPWTGTAEERPVTRVPRGLDLASLVAELRSVACSGHRLAEPAAGELARLAAAGVRGADPAGWYGLAEVSDPAPLREPDEQVPVSPSRVEAFQQCALRWLLESSGGRPGESLDQGVGLLIHDLAHGVATGRYEVDRLADALDEQWPTLDVGEGWVADKQKEHARSIVERLAAWLRSNGRQLVAAEQEFAVEVGQARLSGRVDRLERDAEGRLVVLDLKTGRQRPPGAELALHPQLGAYQLAVTRGGFDEVPAGAAAGRRSGGAALVQLGKGAAATEQHQDSLERAEDPAWAERLIRATAEGMAASVFEATVNRRCAVCPVRRSCPVQSEGGQVTP